MNQKTRYFITYRIWEWGVNKETFKEVVTATHPVLWLIDKKKVNKDITLVFYSQISEEIYTESENVFGDENK